MGWEMSKLREMVIVAPESGSGHSVALRAVSCGPPAHEPRSRESVRSVPRRRRSSARTETTLPGLLASQGATRDAAQTPRPQASGGEPAPYRRRTEPYEIMPLSCGVQLASARSAQSARTHVSTPKYLPKLNTRVRFPSSAPAFQQVEGAPTIWSALHHSPRRRKYVSSYRTGDDATDEEVAARRPARPTAGFPTTSSV